MERQISMLPRCEHGGLLMTGIASITLDVESRNSVSLVQHLAVDIGVLISKMEESIEAIVQASLKTAQDPDGRPFPAYPVYPSGKTWYEASGKKGSMKKFYHNFISEADCAAHRNHHSSHPLLHGGLEIDENSTVV